MRGKNERSRAIFSSTAEGGTIGSDADTLVVRVPASISKEGLLRNLAAALQFPGWFGHNWDALYDCLADLSWIEQRRVVIVHAPLAQLPFADLRAYLEVLRDAIEDWTEDRSRHELAAAFEPSDFRVIEEMGF